MPKSRWGKGLWKKRRCSEIFNLKRLVRTKGYKRRILKKEPKYSNSRRLTIWRTLLNSKRSNNQNWVPEKRKSKNTRRFILIKNSQCSKLDKLRYWTNPTQSKKFSQVNLNIPIGLRRRLNLDRLTRIKMHWAKVQWCLHPTILQLTTWMFRITIPWSRNTKWTLSTMISSHLYSTKKRISHIA